MRGCCDAHCMAPLPFPDVGGVCKLRGAAVPTPRSNDAVRRSGSRCARFKAPIEYEISRGFPFR